MLEVKKIEYKALTSKIIKEKLSGVCGRSFSSYFVEKEWTKSFPTDQKSFEDDARIRRPMENKVGFVDELVLFE